MRAFLRVLRSVVLYGYTINFATQNTTASGTSRAPSPTAVLINCKVIIKGIATVLLRI